MSSPQPHLFVRVLDLMPGPAAGSTCRIKLLRKPGEVGASSEQLSVSRVVKFRQQHVFAVQEEFRSLEVMVMYDETPSGYVPLARSSLEAGETKNVWLPILR